MVEKKFDDIWLSVTEGQRVGKSVEADSSWKSEGSMRVNTRRRIFREKRKLSISLANTFVFTGQAMLSARLGDPLSILIAPLTQFERKA